jgi:hypothetical protein
MRKEVIDSFPFAALWNSWEQRNDFFIKGGKIAAY